MKMTLKSEGSVTDTDVGEGKFTALVSVFGVADSQGDMIMPGAYRDSIQKMQDGGDPIPVLYAHNWSDPNAVIGKIVDMRETEKGLVIDGQLDLSNPLGAQAFKLLKDRRITQFSVGGEESDLKSVAAIDGNHVTQVGKFDLWEVSLCLKGANPETTLISTKSETPPDGESDDTSPATERIESEAPETGPFVYQLTDEQLARLIQGITSASTAAETVVAAPPAEPVRANGITLPELEAWAASMEIKTKIGETMSKQNELDETLAAIKTISTKAMEEHREFTADEAKEILRLKSEAETLKSTINQAQEARAAIKDLLGDPQPSVTAAKSGTAHVAAKSLGAAFTQSDAYRAFKSEPTPDGSMLKIPKTRVAVKADPLITTGSGLGVTPTVMPGYDDLTYRPQPTFLSLIGRGTTVSSYVQYRQMVAVDNNAAVVPEGGLKPLSSIEAKLAEAKVWTCADGVKVTNQELADDGIIATVINDTLTKNLNLTLENLVLNGDGKTDGQPLGVLKTDGVQQIDFDADIFHTAHHAMTALQEIGTGITAVVINPVDTALIDLAQDKNGQYIGNGPFNVGPRMLWGFPVVVSQAVPQGTGIMGDLTTIQLLNREPLTIEAFNQNEDDARHNLTYVRAEERNLLFIREPRRLAVFKTAAAAKPAAAKPAASK